MEPDIDLFNEEGGETLYERKTFVIDKGQEPFRIDKWVQTHMEGAPEAKFNKV